MDTPPQQRGRALPVVLALVVISLLVVPVVLHFGQKGHNRLPFEVETAFPEGTDFVGGEIFASSSIAIMQHELEGTTGWRPNDFVLWGPALWADNNANRQMGIIRAIRESTRVFRDHLTKVSATDYDPNLVDAERLFRNDETKFWFPSSEGRFREANAALGRYVDGLRSDPRTSEPINRRNVEVIRLLQAWTDLLGSAHAKLYGEATFFDTDDHFYHSQGYAHVMYHLSRAVRREYAGEFENRPTLTQLLDQIDESLRRAALLKPLVVIDGGGDGLFANHRRNLDAYLVDARQLIYSMREELEK